MKYLKKFESNSSTDFEEHIEDLFADIASEYPFKIQSENDIVECEISIPNSGMDKTYHFGDTDSEASKNLLKQGKVFQKIASVLNLCNCAFHIKTNQNQFAYTFWLKFFKPDILSNLALQFKHYIKEGNLFKFTVNKRFPKPTTVTILEFKLSDNDDVENLKFCDLFEKIMKKPPFELPSNIYVQLIYKNIKTLKSIKNVNKENYDLFVDTIYNIFEFYDSLSAWNEDSFD